MSDLRGFTAMAGRQQPREVIEFLNLYLEAMVEVISRYEGTIDEIIGDAILVIFGAPLACQDHAAKAVACGLAMQLAMIEVNRRLVAKGAGEVEMGIGIHTGPVIVGNIGSLRRTKYAAVGSNVNRILHHRRPGFDFREHPRENQIAVAAHPAVSGGTQRREPQPAAA